MSERREGVLQGQVTASSRVPIFCKISIMSEKHTARCITEKGTTITASEEMSHNKLNRLCGGVNPTHK